MKIQYLNGGLANQVFQYMFMRYAELSHPEEEKWFLDDSFFFVNHVHNGLELEKVFGLHLNLLSRSFDEEIWQEFIENKKRGISVPQTFKNLGFPMIMITEFENYREHNPFDGKIYRVPGNTFLPEIANVSEEYVYYHGYWLHQGWFEAYKDILKEELAFPKITDEHNLAYLEQILSKKSVAVHIRRGDYVQIGWCSTDQYYCNNIMKILENYPDAAFFVFSDDLEWCRENAENLGLNLSRETIYVEGNTHGKNYIDLQLMSQCEMMILGKSAFGYLAMLLNDRLKWSVSDF